MTPEAPMTLRFTPDDIPHPEFGETSGIVVVQHSHKDSGRIFLCANPLTEEPIGVHLIPEQAAMVRDHLTLLLGEPDADLRAQMEQAAARVKPEPRRRRSKGPRKRWAQFKIEFKFGPLAGLITRLND